MCAGVSFLRNEFFHHEAHEGHEEKLFSELLVRASLGCRQVQILNYQEKEIVDLIANLRGLRGLLGLSKS